MISQSGNPTHVGSSSARGYTATPPALGMPNGLTVYNCTLNEKEENEKGSDGALERLRTHDLRDRRLEPCASDQRSAAEPLRQ